MTTPDREPLTDLSVCEALRASGWEPACEEQQWTNRESWVRGNQRMILRFRWPGRYPYLLVGTTYAPTDLLDGRLAELNETEEAGREAAESTS